MRLASPPTLGLFVLLALGAFGRGEEPVKTGARLRAFIDTYMKMSDGTEEGKKREKKEALDLLDMVDRTLTPSLRSAVSMTAFSLLPDERQSTVRQDPNFFHGYRVLGQIDVVNPQLGSVRDELIIGVGGPAYVLCFNPRHGIRLHTKTGTVDLVICFECGQADVYGLPKTQRLHCSFSKELAPMLDQILDGAKIPRDDPKRPGDLTAKRKLQAQLDRLGKPEFEKPVTRDGETAIWYMAASEVAASGSVAVEPLIEKLRTSAGAHQKSVTFHALRLASQAPELEFEIRKATPDSPVSPPPEEEHEKLQARWLEWWDKYGEAIRRAATVRWETDRKRP